MVEEYPGLGQGKLIGKRCWKHCWVFELGSAFSSPEAN